MRRSRGNYVRHVTSWAACTCLVNILVCFGPDCVQGFFEHAPMQSCWTDERDISATVETHTEDVASAVLHCGAGAEQCWKELRTDKSYSVTTSISGGVASADLANLLVPIFSANFGREWTDTISSGESAYCIIKAGQKAWLSSTVQIYRIALSMRHSCCTSFLFHETCYEGDWQDIVSTRPKKNSLELKCNVHPPDSGTSGSSSGDAQPQSRCRPNPGLEGTHAAYCASNSGLGYCPSPPCHLVSPAQSGGGVAALHSAGCRAKPHFSDQYAEYCRTNGALGHCPALFCDP